MSKQSEKGGRILENQQPHSFIYTYSCHEDEVSLCRLEMRSLFGTDTSSKLLQSPIEIDPSRSPFIKERLQVMYQGDNLAEIVEQVKQIHLPDTTFKVIYVKTNDLDLADKQNYDEHREVERELGWHINGEADMRTPDHVFGIVTLGGLWYFGHYRTNQKIWLRHMKKPQNYSIALGTRLARAVANIAVPDPAGIKAIDPCCGIGTVLVEALSMGIDITGRDINPLIVRGARDNIVHFGLEGEVALGDIADIEAHYDVAIIDMPYNHFSSTTTAAQFSILQHARRIADKAVIISIASFDDMIADAGFRIEDGCVASKRSFSRQIRVCR
jgi:tRNA G10  N-methylase Trm11